MTFDPWIAHPGYNWRLAQTQDIQEILDIAETHFIHEIDQLIKTDRLYYAWQLDKAIVNQRHNLASEQITVACDNHTGEIKAYAWISRGQNMPYSQDELAEAKILHMDLSLSLRTRLSLTVQALINWENWARACAIPVLVSASIREDQKGFMRLHTKLGYTVRGSIGYKRLN
jgi:hypothetical protein